MDDSFISFCMDEKETIVYFYCKKANQSDKEKTNREKRNGEKTNFLWGNMWKSLDNMLWEYKRLGQKIFSKRESMYKALRRRIDTGEENTVFQMKSCYGIRYVSCELPFSLEMILKDDEMAQEKEKRKTNQDFLNFEETANMIEHVKKI